MSLRGNTVNDAQFRASLNAYDSTPVRQRFEWIHEQMLYGEMEEGTEDSLLTRWMRLAAFYDLYGFHSESTAAYTICHQLDPINYHSLFHYASVSVKLGRLEIAKKYFLKALDQASMVDHRAVCCYRLGLLSLRLQDADMAAQYFKESFAEHKYWPAIYERTRLALFEEDWEVFKAYMPELRNKYPMSTEVYHLHLRASESFSLYRAEEMYENPLRVSQLYEENNRDMEDRMRSAIGIDISELFQADNKVAQLDQKIIKLISDADAMQRGFQLFNEAQCAVCHGRNARGNSGPNLCDDYWIYGSETHEIYNSIREGRKNMPAHKYKLSAEQVREVTAYIIQLNLQEGDGSSQIGKEAEGAFLPLRLRE
ncbi:MAG: c-type cytochrome [Planctomycetes bacterium]|nr:c-type cytochrome [Planctomycetota bacterium]